MKLREASRTPRDFMSKDRAPKGAAETPITAADYQTLASFRHGVRRYLAFAEAGARAAGLTSLQHQALLAIKAHTGASPMSIGELAGELLIKHHSAVELVARLLKAGVIDRAEAEEDRRRVSLSLSPAGEKILAALSVKNLRELKIVAPAFSGLMTQIDLLTQSGDSTPSD